MKNLKKILKMRGISQKELAEATGISRAAISQYIAGKHTPSLETAELIADYLKCDLAELKDEVDELKDSRSISVVDASKILGKPPQFLRLALQQGRAPFGFAVKYKEWSYHISKKLFYNYIGYKEERDSTWSDFL